MNKKIKRESVRRLAKWAAGNSQPPIRIDLEPLYGCNLKCKFCWQRSRERVEACDYSNPLDENRILEIIKEAADLGVLEWQIAGGWEPMIKPDFCMRIMKLIKENGMYGCLTTNGTLFTEKTIKELVEIGWDQILFSLEGPNAEIHDYLTGVKGSFEKSVNAMGLFKKWKQNLGKKKPVYSFHTVLTNKNYDKVSEMVKWGAELGCEGVMFDPIIAWSDEGEKLKLNSKQEEEFKEYAKEALKVSRKVKMPTNLLNLLEVELIDRKEVEGIIVKDVKNIVKNKNDDPFLSAPCFAPWLNLEIRISGHVVPCRICNSHQYVNKIHNKSLKDIWYGDYFNRVREQMLNGKLPFYCTDCSSGVVVNIRDVRKELLNISRNPFMKLSLK